MTRSTDHRPETMSLETQPRVVVTMPLLASLFRLFRTSRPQRWMNG
jgi:hypothetical protein